MWVPKYGDFYYVHVSTGVVTKYIWEDEGLDINILRTYGVYKTREEAEAGKHEEPEYQSITGDFLADCLVSLLTPDQVRVLTEIFGETGKNDVIPFATYCSLDAWLKEKK